MTRIGLTSIVLALALGGCATVENPVTGRAERTVMDVPSELAAGREQHPKVVAEYGLVDNPRLQAYVSEVGQRLARQSHRAELEWRFTVVDSPEVNAFALPGGYIYVTRGILAYMNSEADLAGVLGHEIGHVTARHGAQRATRQQTAGLGVLAATVLGAVLEGRGVGGAGDLAQQVSQGVAAGYIARYSREQESQADELGVEYLARTGGDPRHMVGVIQMLVDQERYAVEQARAEGRDAGDRNDWLASHPANEERLRDVRALVARHPGTPEGDAGRERYLRAIDGLPFGERREQGVTRGRHFYHEPLGVALTAPRGWKVQNDEQAVALVHPDGQAGLVMRLVPPEAGRSHEEILRQGVQAEQGRTERLSLNGMPATRFVGTRRNAQGQSVPVTLTIVTGPQDRHYVLLHAAADAAALERARGGLREAESSFRPLGAAERAAARPWTLQVVPFPRGGFAELARGSPLPDAERHLRLLNGVYSSGGPAIGQLVKVVR